MWYGGKWLFMVVVLLACMLTATSGHAYAAKQTNEATSAAPVKIMTVYEEKNYSGRHYDLWGARGTCSNAGYFFDTLPIEWVISSFTVYGKCRFVRLYAGLYEFGDCQSYNGRQSWIGTNMVGKVLSLAVAAAYHRC